MLLQVAALVGQLGIGFGMYVLLGFRRYVRHIDSVICRHKYAYLPHDNNKFSNTL